MTAAGAPSASMGTARNCAAPAKTSSDMPHTSSGRSPACTARPPNTVPYTNTEGTSASDATRPARSPDTATPREPAPEASADELNVRRSGDGHRVPAGDRLDRPGVGADDRDLAVGQPPAGGEPRPRAALVVLGVVLLPQLAMAGAKQDGVALARRLLDALALERLLDVGDGDDVVDRQAVAAFHREDVEQDAAREERLEMLHAELLEPVGGADLLLGEAVVVADLAVAGGHADVPEAVELRADLADLAYEQLIVVVELVVAERPTRRRARDDDVRPQPLAEQRDALLEHAAQRVDLAGLDQAGRLEDLGRGHAVVGSPLVLRAPGRRPPAVSKGPGRRRLGLRLRDLGGRHAGGYAS